MDSSEKILRLRRKNKMTREKLAMRVGVGKDVVEKWENGTLKPSEVEKKRLAKVFNIEAGYFADRRPSLIKVISIRLDRLTKRHRLAVLTTAAVSLVISFVFLMLAMDHLMLFFGTMALISVVISCLAFIFYGRNKKN